jgi:4a-hydroxytetrahydrobiopterin dehydratase
VTELANKRCTPCRGGIPPLTGDALEQLHSSVPFWDVVDEHHLSKSFLFPDFALALNFVVRIGTLAEQEGHHPDLCLSWGKVDVKIYTHKIGGLSENDFILAAKIDELYFSNKP